MTHSDFADRLRARDPLVGAWMLSGDPVVAEVLAQEGFDFVVADGEHGEHDIETLGAQVRAVDAARGDPRVEDGADVVVRAPSSDPAWIKRVLDLGPRGVIVPQIEDVEEARRAVEAASYPPDGVRGVAGTRPSRYGLDVESYVASANEDVATILQVETVGAVEDAREIAALDGVDALLIGPADLSARHGVFGEFESDPFREAIEYVVEAADAAETAVGTLATTRENLATRHEWGLDYVVAGTDVGYLREASAAYRERYADLVGED